jgi:hypothetical protein
VDFVVDHWNVCASIRLGVLWISLPASRPLVTGGEKNRMTSQKNNQQPRLFIPVTVFVLAFLLFGAVGFFAASFDGNGGGSGNPIVDPICWISFFLFGVPAGSVGFLLTRYAGSIIKWWREPTDKQNPE